MFVVLSMSKGVEEENAFNVVITETDSREDVLEKIVQLLK